MIHKILFNICCIFLIPVISWAQSKNTVSEVRDYRESDGKIIITCIVNGIEADFLLDLAGQSAILPEYIEKFGIDLTEKGQFPYDEFQYKNVPVKGSVKLNSISFGNTVFANGLSVFVLEDASYLRELGVAGVMGGSLFQMVVLTINSQRKKITMSQPYRPSYLKLTSRVNAELQIMGAGMQTKITINGQTFPCVIDTWNTGTVELTPADFSRVQGENTTTKVFNGYTKEPLTTPAKVIKQFQFVNDTFPDVTIAENPSLKHSVIGNGILKHGILAVDYLHQTIYFQPFNKTAVQDEMLESQVTITPGKVNDITGAYFKEHIHDYHQGTDFIYKGNKPIIIDFWATWCGPCKKMAPLFEQWAEKYKDQIIFLKVNADKEKELCNRFKINALPTFMILPVNGKPIIEIGADPQKIEKVIIEQLVK